MTSLDYDHLFHACRELFGPDVDISPEFLHYLQHNGLKAAFRRRAKETHPDNFSRNSPHVQDTQAALFCTARSAYETLSSFISQREKDALTGITRPISPPFHRDVPAARGPSGEFYSRPVPQRALKLGRYLYYRKIITFQELLQAVTWQRSGRRRMGSIARDWGWITTSDVFTVLSAKVPGKFGEKAIRLGILNPSRVKLMLQEQQIGHQRIGQYFVQSKVLTPQELDSFLKELRLHNARFKPPSPS